MKASDFDLGNYLNAATAKAHVGKELHILTIESEIIRDQAKMVMSFRELGEKGLVVNKTNRTALADAFGDETDAWTGKSVQLRIGQVLFQGRMVPSIQVVPITERQDNMSKCKKK